MNVVKDTKVLTLVVKKDKLFEGRYLYVKNLTAMLKELEDADNMKFKLLRNKFYNSSFGNKYNFKEICGLKCIDTVEPMRGKASLDFIFKVED